MDNSTTRRKLLIGLSSAGVTTSCTVGIVTAAEDSQEIEGELDISPGDAEDLSRKTERMFERFGTPAGVSYLESTYTDNEAVANSYQVEFSQAEKVISTRLSDSRGYIVTIDDELYRLDTESLHTTHEQNMHTIERLRRESRQEHIAEAEESHSGPQTQTSNSEGGK